MQFVKQFLTPSGVQTEFHKITKLEWSTNSGQVLVHISSWPSEADYVAGKAQVWVTYHGMQLPADTLTSIGNTLLTVGDFESATVVSDAGGTLDAARERKWAEVKATRDYIEFGGFTWDGSTFDSNPISQSRIQGAALMALLAAQANQTFSQDWTLADNTTRILSGQDMINVGLALGLHVGATHAIARGLRQAIESASNQATLDAIQWPTEN